MKAHESMGLGRALQARCLEAVAKGKVGPESCVVTVPPEIDAAVASAYLELSAAHGIRSRIGKPGSEDCRIKYGSGME